MRVCVGACVTSLLLYSNTLAQNSKRSVEQEKWTAECGISNSFASDTPGNTTWGWFHNGKAVREGQTGSTCSEGREVFAIRGERSNSDSTYLTLVACGVPYTDMNKYRCKKSTLERQN